MCAILPKLLSVSPEAAISLPVALVTENVSRRTDDGWALTGVSSVEGGTGVPISASLS